MEQTKWRKPEVIHHQFTQLKFLVARASEATPFRRNCLDASILAPHFNCLKGVWDGSPLLKRYNLQSAEYVIHLDFSPEDHCRIFGKHSSGSAGKTKNEAFSKQ